MFTSPHTSTLTITLTSVVDVGDGDEIVRSAEQPPTGWLPATSRPASPAPHAVLSSDLGHDACSPLPSVKKRISLCMIARDEAAMIADCIASAAGAVDEVVVVDTGSEDGTAEVARRAGARVVSFAWRDDFAAARNASIAAATGDWVLVLDADERLAPGAAAAVRTAVRRPSAPAGALRLHDASRLDATAAEVLSGSARLGEPTDLPRLFRRDPDLAYEGVIHEHVTPWVVRHGRKVMRVEADIVHLGAVPELRNARGKRGRNIALLRRRCQDDPLDFDAAGYLAQELYMEGAFEEAWRVVEEVWQRRATPSPVGTHRLAVARAILARRAHMPDEMLETVADQEQRNGPHPELAFLRGCALEEKAAAEPARSPGRTGRLEEAEAAYRTALADFPNRLFDSLRGARSWLSHTQLGTVLLLLGRPAQAAEAFQAALHAQPGHREAELGLAEVDLAEGRPLAALRRLEPMLGKVRDAWWLAACAATDLGSAPDAKLFFSRALADRDGVKAWHRAEAMAAAAARAAPPGQETAV